jgi:hypothetical protein
MKPTFATPQIILKEIYEEIARAKSNFGHYQIIFNPN